MPDPSVLLLVIDGIGISRERTAAIVREVWANLPRGTRDLLQSQAASVLERQPSTELDPADLARLSLHPVFAGALQSETPFTRALDTLSALRHMHSAAEGTRVHADIHKAITAEAARSRYVPWTAPAPNVRAAWNTNLTVPTSAAGVWAGYEQMTPPVQGNSETGHQQIGNLRLAPQTPLEISLSIADGSFWLRQDGDGWQTSIAGHQVEGDYPDLDGQFSRDGLGANWMDFERAELVHVLNMTRRVVGGRLVFYREDRSVWARSESQKRIHMNHRLKLKSTAAKMGGPDDTLTMSPDYLDDAVSGLGDVKVIRLQYGGAASPILVTAEGVPHRFIVMPMTMTAPVADEDEEKEEA